jgi:NAD(P)-dependent dehydrogenase (short-subunit alcohol dehydrogenase family)
LPNNNTFKVTAQHMKTVLITGGSGNLGTAVVAAFLQDGCNVVAAVHDKEDKNKLLEHPNLRVQAVNLQDEGETTAFIQNLTATTPVHTALLLAGGYAPGDIEHTTLNLIRSQISLNFETAYAIARPLFQHMLQQGTGRLVFIGSQPALMPRKGKTSLAYALSKALLFNLAEILNEAAKGTDVVTSVVVPSTIDTPPNRESMPSADPSKWVPPAELAGVLRFICSDEAAALREPVFKVYKNTF